MANEDATKSGPWEWLRRAVIGRNPKRTLLRVAIVIVASVVIFRFVLLPVRVEGISMLPTYQDHSIKLINRLAYLRHGPQRGDVAGIRVGGTNVLYRVPSVMYMKRIVGLPGETVAFRRGHLFIDGQPLDESYLKEPCDWNAAPVQVGANQYYFVGDNRSMPQEYHDHGKAGREQIVGKVID